MKKWLLKITITHLLILFSVWDSKRPGKFYFRKGFFEGW